MRAKPDQDEVFRDNAVALRRAGLAVLPARGKQPMMRGFNKWKVAPGENVVGQWAAANPTADIVYVPGLSRLERNRPGLVVVDFDDEASEHEFGAAFGDTPVKVRTRRGRHRIYRAPTETLGRISSLKRYGAAIDIKHGNSIVVAPPSRHQDQRDFQYRWDGCDPSALREVPEFNVKALQSILERGVRPQGSKTLLNDTQTAPAPRPPRTSDHFRENSRGLALNDVLVSRSGHCNNLDELLDFARAWNSDLPNSGFEPLCDDEVIQRTRVVWSDYQSGKLVKTHHHRAIGITDADEIRRLALYSNGDAAHMLLMLLRAEHDARCKRGETFSLSIKGMVQCRTLGFWSARKYREARDVLLELGLILCVTPAGVRTAAEYTLTQRMRTASVAVRRAAEQFSDWQ